MRTFFKVAVVSSRFSLPQPLRAKAMEAAYQSTHEDFRELRGRRNLRPQLSDHNAFTLEELQSALAKLKPEPQKAPGPDGAPNLLFRLLDDDNTIRLWSSTTRTGTGVRFQMTGSMGVASSGSLSSSLPRKGNMVTPHFLCQEPFCEGHMPTQVQLLISIV